MSRRDPVSPEDAERGRAIAEWRARYPEAWGFEMEWDDELGIPIPVGRREDQTFCGKAMRDGRVCYLPAGTGTAHVGVGACFRHDSQVERAAGAWAVAHQMARILDISPWDALLLAVRRAAAWAAFYDTKLAEVVDDDELRPGGTAHDWVKAAERVNDKLARYSKMAVDAGVAQLLVQQARTEGEQVARVLNAAIAAVELTRDQERMMRQALAQALRGLGGEQDMIEGESTNAGTEEPSEEPST